MSRFRRAEVSLRGEDGFSLTELLVAMLVGVVVLFGIFQMLDTSFSLSRRTQQRVDAAQRGRLALDLVTRDLRAQVCLSSTEPALISAADSDIVYYANLGATTATPEKHEIVLSGGDLVFKRWVGTPASAGSIPSVTYPASPTSTRILAENVQPVSGVPLFRYYAWTAGSSPTPSTLLATPLSSANLPLQVKIAIAFTVLPERAFHTTRPTATFEDSVFMRMADPNDTTHGPACN